MRCKEILGQAHAGACPTFVAGYIGPRFLCLLAARVREASSCQRMPGARASSARHELRILPVLVSLPVCLYASAFKRTQILSDNRPHLSPRE